MVIAIIAILIGLLLPAVQKVREAAAHQRAIGEITRLAGIVLEHSRESACEQVRATGLDCLIRDDGGVVAAGEGYLYEVPTVPWVTNPCQAEDGRGALAVALPMVPGRTGLYQFCLLPADDDGLPSVQGVLVPGALDERGRMFAELKEAATAQLRALGRGPSLGIANNRARLQEVMRLLNRDGDDTVTLGEILRAEAPANGRLRPLFGRGGALNLMPIAEIMRLDMAGGHADALRVSAMADVLLDVDR